MVLFCSPPLCHTAYVLYVCSVIWALLPAINHRSFPRSERVKTEVWFWRALATALRRTVLFGRDGSRINCWRRFAERQKAKTSR